MDLIKTDCEGHDHAVLRGMLGFLRRSSSLPVLFVGLMSPDYHTDADQQAALLGLPVARTRTFAYLAAAGLTSLAVTTAGTVGFIGLVVPHLLRLLGATDHRSLVPGAALAGGTLLVVADTVARTMLAPRQLPVGAITAVIGVPLFLLLLRQGTARSRPA